MKRERLKRETSTIEFIPFQSSCILRLPHLKNNIFGCMAETKEVVCPTASGLVAYLIKHGPGDRIFYIHFGLCDVNIICCGACARTMDMSGQSSKMISEYMYNHWRRNVSGDIPHPVIGRPSRTEIAAILDKFLNSTNTDSTELRSTLLYEADLVEWFGVDFVQNLPREIFRVCNTCFREVDGRLKCCSPASVVEIPGFKFDRSLPLLLADENTPSEIMRRSVPVPRASCQ